MTDTSHIEVLREMRDSWAELGSKAYDKYVAACDAAIRALSPAGGDWVMVLADVLERDGGKACNCINHSRKAEREYEAGQCPHQRAAAMLAASPQQEPGAALPTEADDLAMHAKLRDLLTGKSLYVMGREHAEDVRKPLYEISFGMVMEDKILFRSKDAGYITTRHTPEEQDPSGQALAGEGGLSVLMEAAGDVLRADISGSRGVALIPRDRIEALRNAVASIEATSAGTTGDDSEDAARLDFMQANRVALIPEFEGPWDAEIYGEDGHAVAVYSGTTPRAAIDAARRAREVGNG